MDTYLRQFAVNRYLLFRALVNQVHTNYNSLFTIRTQLQTRFKMPILTPKDTPHPRVVYTQASKPTGGYTPPKPAPVLLIGSLLFQP